MAIDLSAYPRARDLFEAARSAAHDANRCWRAIDAMSAREGVRGRGAGPAVRGGAAGSGMAATDERIDWEEANRARIAGDYELIDLAFSVCYGEDGRHGVWLGVGGAYADALCMRYVDPMSWREVASRLDVAESTARLYVAVALDAVDSVGIAGAIAGEGPAGM